MCLILIIFKLILSLGEIKLAKKIVHLIKLCVGAQNVSDLYNWQKNRIIYSKNSKKTSTFLVTRMRPKREVEILNGGSIFWVFKGLILARQKIIGFDNFIGEDNILKCKIMLDKTIILTEPYQKKPFQGWRYFKVQNAPKDREIFSNEKKQLPLKIEKELSEIGVL
tara:strand:+ start:39 stop:536 length:498 start_codon:yes stop_codon:yes gene_type:complete